ncbi:hypothetical protein L207DRAFT_249877 [Hyaloscypha variabilis F]|uniref:Uncharacterized protein n=1 Tax=Hyaloscypha variabilis (strain UAMH 11265 / GT02V1 / F) TaxID=1149755 RepID=A0A2J6S365_HYAVF|nr:hypothetical protein L207DRAFT_249877 [Hyaloscypha variabilis F]
MYWTRMQKSPAKRPMLCTIEQTHTSMLRRFQFLNTLFPSQPCPNAKKWCRVSLSNSRIYFVCPVPRYWRSVWCRVLQATSQFASLFLCTGSNPDMRPSNAKMNSFHAQPAVDSAEAARSCNKIR